MNYAAVQDETIRLLLSRVDDLCNRGERGEAAVTPYLTPREAKYARARLSARLSAGTALLWGGYAEAERVRALILPDYVEGLVDPDSLASDPVSALAGAGLEDLADTLRNAVRPILVKGSGFRELTHRDYLGSVLGLGLERDAVGDILIPDAHSAILFTDARVGDFLGAMLEKVATDTGAPLYVGVGDEGALGDPIRNLSGVFQMCPPLRIHADKTLKEGDQITVGELTLTVMETPGHTPGCICLRQDDVLFSGDTLFCDSIGRVDFPGGDVPAMVNSLQRLMKLPAETKVYSGHGSVTTIGREVECNPYLQRI